MCRVRNKASNFKGVGYDNMLHGQVDHTRQMAMISEYGAIGDCWLSKRKPQEVG
jgi:hypothetical protein